MGFVGKGISYPLSAKTLLRNCISAVGGVKKNRYETEMGVRDAKTGMERENDQDRKRVRDPENYEVKMVRDHLIKENIRFGADEFDMSNWNRFAEFCTENDETPIPNEVSCYLSVSAALASKDAPMWIEAMTKERVKLEAAKTWRECTKKEIIENSANAVPVVLLLTRKRDGTFKCRAIVLGNRVDKPDDWDLYAPVVSLMAMRNMMIHAARDGDQIKVFDLDNAFLNAEISEDTPTYVKIPKIWAGTGVTTRALVKALYGLPQSPKLWYKKYEAGLKELGWSKSDVEGGLWRKRSKNGKSWIKMAVYVDDNIICAPSENELGEEMNKFLKKFPGREVPPEEQGGWKSWDILGADVLYSAQKRTLRIFMTSYIESMHRKFEVEKRIKRIPTVPMSTEDGKVLGASEPIYDGKFDYRSAVGSIQWCATVARPDIARPINLLAKWNNETPTKARVGALIRIMAYLMDTAEMGITYSPNSEKEWYQSTRFDGNGKPVAWSSCGLDLYTDASWASEIENSYSISGMVITVFGTPVAWKSKRQTIRADSTCAAEYIAAADGIQWCANMGRLEFFDFPAVPEGGIPKSLRIFLDSSSAVQVAKNEEGKPKTRWLALRWHRAQDEKDKIRFVKTAEQKADVLTKAPRIEAIRLLFGSYGCESVAKMKCHQYEPRSGPGGGALKFSGRKFLGTI